uniref:Uncharacterized protein n=1 Tax=Rhizophora mucronata TaxID=61149 RepID=A0A2P2QVR6_RHIMU
MDVQNEESTQLHVLLPRKDTVHQELNSVELPLIAKVNNTLKKCYLSLLFPGKQTEIVQVHAI